MGKPRLDEIRPAIVLVSPRHREFLLDEFGRYSRDYDLRVTRSAGEAFTLPTQLTADGIPVAMTATEPELPDVDLYATAAKWRAVVPTARCSAPALSPRWRPRCTAPRPTSTSTPCWTWPASAAAALIEAEAIGGQAGTSSMIRNYSGRRPDDIDTVRAAPAGDRRPGVPALEELTGLGVFYGAAAGVRRDSNGFVLTGRDVPKESWPGELPPTDVATTVAGVSRSATSVPAR